jgi:hypothetical protein
MNHNRRSPKGLSETTVKLYFQILTNEAQSLNQELLELSKPALQSMRKVINELGNHYGDVCSPAARGTQARLLNLETIFQAIDLTLTDLKKVRAELNRLEKSARKLKQRVVSKKTKEITENLWYK